MFGLMLVYFVFLFIVSLHFDSSLISCLKWKILHVKCVDQDFCSPIDLTHLFSWHLLQVW